MQRCVQAMVEQYVADEARDTELDESRNSCAPCNQWQWTILPLSNVGYIEAPVNLNPSTDDINEPSESVDLSENENFAFNELNVLNGRSDNEFISALYSDESEPDDKL